MNPQTDAGLLGAHTSAAGGAWHALEQGKKIGATTVQLFTANQRRWHSKPLSEDAIKRFRALAQQEGMTQLMSHASYLLNLGSPRPEALVKSRAAFVQEIQRCLSLGISYLNFHPGAALDGSRQDALDRIVASLQAVGPLLEGGQLHLLLEATAGQGSNIGSSFEELGYVVKALPKDFPVGVCLDTCHIFAAGYDIRTTPAWEDTLALFDTHVGLHYLKAFHLNDSKHALGARKDRHAPLGEGHIGWQAFYYLMHSPATRHLPKYLETPGGPARWQEEIAHLRAH